MENTGHPLVTFVILAYNAEGFIEESINGAFSQCYPNLEIIISDDGSSDATYSIVKKVVESYGGPHRVFINRNEKNLGTLAHFFKVVDLSSGRLIILSAADDISVPQRASVTVENWKRTGASAYFSDYFLINDQGSVINDNYSPGKYSKMIEKVFGFPYRYEIHGASSAYDVEFVRSLPRPRGKFLFEDAYMTFMLNAFSKAYYKIDAPLVKYRQHSGSVSNSSGAKVMFRDERLRQIRMLDVYDNRYRLSVFLLQCVDLIDVKGFSRPEYLLQVEKFKVKSRWVDAGFVGRLKLILFSPLDLKFKFWILVRVFGVDFFVLMKVFFRRFKRCLEFD